MTTPPTPIAASALASGLEPESLSAPESIAPDFSTSPTVVPVPLPPLWHEYEPENLRPLVDDFDRLRVAARQPGLGLSIPAEQRIRELMGLGPAPGTTSRDEDRAAGGVPDRPTVAWTGELQADSVMLSQSDNSKQQFGNLENFSDLRRARLGAIGSLYLNTIYRLEFEFMRDLRPRVLDIFGQFTDLPLVDNVRIGHFFEPFSISRLTSNRYQSFMERPLLDAFAPVRNLGVMAFRTYDDKRGCLQLGVFAEDSNDDGGSQTDRGGTSVTGRATYLPMWDDPSDGRYLMHVGGCFSHRSVGDRVSRFGYWPGFRPGSFEGIVWPRWADTGNIATHQVDLFDVEWAWVNGPFHAMAEYAVNMVNQVDGPRLVFQAWYFETGWFLTGESRPYLREVGVFNRVIPFENAFLANTSRGMRRGRGSLQAVFRVDYLDLNDQNIRGGRLFDLTWGLNWYVNPHTLMSFNYVHAQLERGAVGMSYGNLFGLRAQFEF